MLATESPRRTQWMAIVALTTTLVLGAHGLADVFSWNADVLPVDGGWGQLQLYCEPETWVEGGWYFQQLDYDACSGAEFGAQDSLRNELDEYIDHPSFFVEWRVQGDGPASALIFGAPTALAVAGHGEVTSYAFFIGDDMARLNRSNFLPEAWVPVAPNVPHTHRLEHYGSTYYIWYIDGVEASSGQPEGQFPGIEPFITWRGRAYQTPSINKWSFIRYGDIPVTNSGDFDSDGDIDGRDAYYFAECVAERGNGPGLPVDPGCVWADVDADGSVDFHDFAALQRIFTGPGE